MLQHIIGLGKKTGKHSVVQSAFVHIDCVFGNPFSQSDSKLKTSVTTLERPNCLSLCNALAPSAYVRIDTKEVGAGLIAQDVRTALAAHSFPDDGIIGCKFSRAYPSPGPGVPGGEPEELMTLNYKRMVPLLLGAVQKLTERVAQLEQR